MTEDGELAIILLSLRVGIVAVLLMLPPAFLLAWILERTRIPGRILIDVVAQLPLVLPPVVTGWLLLIALGPASTVGRALRSWVGVELVFSWMGAAIAAAVMALPLMVRAIRLALNAIDHRHEDAARTLGAGRWRVFATITLPLSFPGIAAALVLGFARALGEFGATITFAANIAGETRTLPLAIYSALQRPGGEEMVWRLALYSVLLGAGALLASEWLARRYRTEDRDVL